MTPTTVTRFAAALAIAASVAGLTSTRASIQAQGKQAPMFEVDPFWPQPLPNHWVTGSTIGNSAFAS